MAENARRQLMEELANRNKMGDKKFHSETSLQHYGEDEDPKIQTNKDPGVLNQSMNSVQYENKSEDSSVTAKRRAMSQPGPVSGGLITATAARAARKRPQRNVMYAEPTRTDSIERQPPKYLNPIRIDDIDSASTPGDRGSPNLLTANYRNGDVKSLNSYRIYTPNEVRGASTPRKRSVGTMDGQSIRSVETQAPPPTDPEVKRDLTSTNLTVSLSCMYAILLITFGIIVYIGDAFVEATISATYSIILTCIGFIYMIFLLTDIHRYKTIALKNQRIKSQHEEKLIDFFRKQEMEYGSDTPEIRTPDFPKTPPMLPPPVLIPLKHDYCFSQGRHSGSFYLKLGAAGFALGHLVHSLLLITVQIGLFLDEDINNDECVDILMVILDIINPLFCFFQLYFIFKYSNVIIMKGQGLARFAFMHYIGTSLSFWISAIVRETILALTIYAGSQYGNGYDESNYTSTTSGVDPDNFAQNRFINISGLYDANCVGSAATSLIFESFSPYLYPFTVEFNILIVAVYYIIWSNIGHCGKEESSEDDDMSSSLYGSNNIVCKIPSATEENDFSSNIVIYADCHASNRGLFLGMIYTVLTIGILILGFIFGSVGENFKEVGYLVNDIMKLFLHISLLIAALFAFNQTRKLDINEHPISLLDDILLFICLPAFFMETVFSMIATLTILNIIKSIDFMVMVIQVVIQTALIVDGLRRCSNTRKLRRTKPGRELIMFLLIVNVSMWIFNTFSYKSPESLDERYEFYGKVMWTILGHVSLPLIMFYRFHSSVCFADMWDSIYKPGSSH